MAALRYTESAESDWLEAWLWVAKDNPPATDRMVGAITQEAKRLVAHPHAGWARPEWAEGLRS